MNRLAWTAPALADLRAIDAWLIENRDRDFAERTLAAIEARARFLENFRHGGRTLLKQDFRVLRVFETPYLLVYRVRSGQLQILRVRHEREDWQTDA
ncbi:MAG: type II toxin-antitoxin system RelE/ParE family toxin [Sphingomonadaceae bacterium]|nr:type II toxin-antitoxin system RelE/ParE family toxin [Sphingomonadaceae bacterium]